MLELTTYAHLSSDGSRYDGEMEEQRRSKYRAGLVSSGLQLTRRNSSASNAMVQFATGSTLLPQNVAEMVTNLALLARVSIKSTAFFIEVILEAAKYSTGMGLGLTRRALISAVGTARAIHALKNDEEWDAKKAGQGSLRGIHALARANQKAAFLSVLDKYTALGVYLIHHSFTLAELFAQSGFYLADQSIKAGLSAADESVRIIDGIFGSNETSRALSSFITMVRNELSGDEMLQSHTGGGIWTVAALTKALTIFAVLQNATFRRTAKIQKTRVLYDCLVLGEAETKNWRSQILGSGNFIKKELPPVPPNMIPPRTSSYVSSQQNIKSPRASRLQPASSSIRSGMSNMRRSKSIFGVDEPCILDVDVNKDNEDLLSDDMRDSSTLLMEDLDYLVGAEEEDDLDDGNLTPTRRIIALSETRLEDLPREMRDTLAQANAQELERGVVLPEREVNGIRPRDVKRVIRQKGVQGGSAIYEITTETTEVIEETTTTTLKEDTYSRAKKSNVKNKRLPNPFGAFANKQEKERIVQSLSSEDDWFAVEGQQDLSFDENAASGIPQVANGSSALQNVASNSRKEAIQHPEESRQRVQEVVKTITRRLIQRKRIVQQVEIEDVTSDEEMTNNTNTIPYSPQGSKRKGDETPRSTLIDKHEGSGKTGDIAFNLQRALGRAKTSLQTKQNARQTLNVSDQKIDQNHKTPTKNYHGIKHLSHQEKELPMTPSFGAALPDISASVRRSKRRTRAGSISSVRSFASHSHTHVQSTTTTRSNDTSVEEGPFGAPGSFPRQHLVKNLRRFMRHSSAAYGQNFMRVLGIGDIQYSFADTRERSANIFAYAHHVGIPPDSVLLSSYCEGASLPFHSEKMAPIVNYISRDDVCKAIVLTCRGTLGLSDVLTDLTCTFVDVEVEDGNPNHCYQVHSGMLASAQRLAARGNTVLETLKSALEANPDYGLVLTGHSLGGGVACLLAMQLSSPSHTFQTRVMQDKASSIIRHPKITTPFVTGYTSGLPPGRPIHAYAYGSPAITSPDLSRYCKGLCTSAVHSFDVVPCLSLGTLHDLKAVACSLSDEKESLMAQDVLGRVVGLYQKKKQKAQERIKSKTTPPLLAGSTHSTEFNDEGEAEILRPTELPLHERNLHLNVEELAHGRTKNRANEANYKDPHYSEEDGVHETDRLDDDQDLNDWLWSLIKTMRASMDNNKLYPPGTVYLLEMQQVHVTAKMSEAQEHLFMKHGQKQGITSNRAEAARVILRLVEDVTSRFAEPIFSRSLFRDHLPTNYELVTQLLWEAVVPKEEQEQVEANETQAASSSGPPP